MSHQASVNVVRPPSDAGPRARTRTRLRDRVRRRPLVWFFLLAFLMSWAAWTPYVLSGDGLGVMDFGFPSVLGTTQLVGVLPGAYLGPIVSALLVTAVSDGRPGLRSWTARMTKWRVGWRWYAGIVVAVPAALTLVTTVLSGARPVLPAATVLIGLLPGLVLQMITTGLAEEPGWRDYAMPRLQRRYGPFLGTLVLGPLWGVWHLPLFLTEWGGWPDVHWSAPVEFVAATTAFSFVMTWVFNHTGQTLLPAMLLHASVNNFFSFGWSDVFPSLPPASTTHAFLVSSGAATVVLLIATRGRLGLPPARATGTAA
ncbi:CPBP family intramembrane glutamic endopeptidase [Streptomyces sp. NPDC014889]|uniref:CPBP family intramembrane glutamic endopeptidase n=1 Tax=Streptomyces sp. NPDC014889 TaxID=3364928 RepID=UPI0037011585